MQILKPQVLEYIYINTHTQRHVTAIKEKESHEFEREKKVFTGGF